MLINDEITYRKLFKIVTLIKEIPPLVLSENAPVFIISVPCNLSPPQCQLNLVHIRA